MKYAQCVIQRGLLIIRGRMPTGFVENVAGNKEGKGGNKKNGNLE